MSDTPESANEKEIDKATSALFTDHDHEIAMLKDVKADDEELLNAIGYKQVRLG
jgi:hypothetical protein